MEAERPLSFFRDQQDAFALVSELQRESVATSTTGAPQASCDFAPACDQGMTPTPAVCWRNVDPSARILVVAADPGCLKQIRRTLYSVGYNHVSVTSNSRQVLPMLRSESPDVLLLDLNMPEITGLDILRVAGLDSALQHIPVLLLSDDKSAAIRRHALELGASDFLGKPVDPDELLARVRNSLVVRKHYRLEVEQAFRLQAEFQVRSREMEFTRNQLILCLARAAEHRDRESCHSCWSLHGHHCPSDGISGEASGNAGAGSAAA